MVDEPATPWARYLPAGADCGPACTGTARCAASSGASGHGVQLEGGLRALRGAARKGWMTRTTAWCWPARRSAARLTAPAAARALSDHALARRHARPGGWRRTAADTLSRVPGAPHTTCEESTDAPPEPSRAAACGRVPIVPARPEGPAPRLCGGGGGADPGAGGMRGRQQRAGPALAPAHERGVGDDQGGRRRDRDPQRVHPGRPAERDAARGQLGSLFVGLVNTGPRDRLVRISAPAAATSVVLPQGGVLLEQDQSALLTGPAPKLVLTGLTRSLPGGTYVKVFLTFQNAGTVSLDRSGDRPLGFVRHVLAGPARRGVHDGQRVTRAPAPGIRAAAPRPPPAPRLPRRPPPLPEDRSPRGVC